MQLTSRLPPVVYARAAIQRASRWFAVPGGMGVVFVLLLAMVALAARMSAFASLQPFPDRAGLDYSADTFAPIAPVSAEFIAGELGSDVFERLGGSASPQPVGSTGSPDAGGPPPAVLPSGLDPLFGGDWEFHASMASDRQTAEPGDQIVYTVTVRNVGEGDFIRGSFEIESHWPLGTTSYDQPCANGQYVDPDDPEGCPEGLKVPFPAPGTGSEQLEGNHEPPCTQEYGPCFFRAGNFTLLSGDSVSWSFAVTVNQGTPPGAEIVNHAHAVANLVRVDSNEVTVVVG